MAYLGTFVANTKLLAAELNQLNAVTFVSATSNLTVATASNGTLTFALGDVVTDPAGWYTVATSRITPNVAGIYAVGCQVTMGANAGAIAYTAVLKNGATIVGKNKTNLATAGANSNIQTAGLVSMNGTTDYLTSIVYQSSGVNVTATGRQMYAYLLRKS